jgi:hypothetical protein
MNDGYIKQVLILFFLIHVTVHLGKFPYNKTNQMR